MAKFTALVGTDADGKIYKVDVIEHEGKKWLVPYWLEYPDLGYKAPLRVISLDALPHEEIRSGKPANYLLNGPVPKLLLENRALTEIPTPFVVIESPDIRVPLQRKSEN